MINVNLKPQNIYNISLLRKEARLEAKGLKKTIAHIQGRNKCQIRRNFSENFDEIINRLDTRW